MKNRRRWFVLALVLVVTWLVASAVVLAKIRARRLPPYAEFVPASLVNQIEVVRLATSDGESIGAWFLPETRDDAPTVIELHGKGGNRAVRLGAADIVRERGAAVMLVTLRAHGDSTGDHEDFGWSARNDVVAAVEWVRARRPDRRVFVHGASLGAAAAVFAADELGARVDGYAFECLYRDIETAAKSRCEAYLPPLLDSIAYAGLRVVARVAWTDFARISPLAAIERVPRSASILLMAGSGDMLARREETDALFAAVSDRARLVVIEGAPHDRLQSHDPERYRKAVLGWIDGR